MFQNRFKSLDKVVARLTNRYDIFFPVNVNELAEKMNIEILSVDCDPEIDGFCFYTADGSPQIVVNDNTNIPEYRKRWTITHEIGHVRYREEQAICWYENEYISTNHEVERWCDMFAAKILMPSTDVTHIYDSLRIYSYRQKLSSMAVIFNVSKQAMGIRLKELNLV